MNIRSVGASHTMANLPAAGMKSMGMFLGIEGCDASRLEEAFEMITTRRFGKMHITPKVKHVKEDDASKTNILDLNIKENTLTTTSHLCAIVRDFDGELNMQEITAFMQKNLYTSLPEPLREKAETANWPATLVWLGGVPDEHC